VTAVLPRGAATLEHFAFAGWYAMNGDGELTGTTGVDELGFLEGPVMITNTHSVGVVHAAVIAWRIARGPRDATGYTWSNPVVGETWDGWLNDIDGFHVKTEHVFHALDSAHGGAVEEGSVGGGTGMNCYHFKGGSGTASRLVDDYSVGVFVQANFGARRELVLAGVPLGDALADDDPMLDWDRAAPGSGSVIALVATDAPLFPHQCQALARRVTAGLARTGTSGSHFSGDLFLAFSTANPGAFRPGDQTMSRLEFVPWERLDPYYEAVVQATEEAVVNALVANEDMTGRDGHRTPALPRDRVTGLLAAADRLR
jgi:D-aminopeptidase